LFICLNLKVRFDPVDVGGGSAVNAWVTGLGASVTPRDDATVLLVGAAGHWAAGVSLAGVLVLVGGADVVFRDVRASVSGLTV